jgi:hypothetical protein
VLATRHSPNPSPLFAPTQPRLLTAPAGKSDPYLVISRASNTGWTVVHKTEVIKHTLNPRWRPIEMPITKLCNAETERPLRVRSCTLTMIAREGTAYTSYALSHPFIPLDGSFRLGPQQ